MSIKEDFINEEIEQEETDDALYFGKVELPQIQMVQHLVRQERLEQYLKWGNQSNKGDHIWMLILMEEFGETAESVMLGQLPEAITESIQTAAVANAWSEAIHKRDIHPIPEDQKHYATAIFLTFIKFGEMSKALLENDLDKAMLLTHEVMKEIHFLRTFMQLKNENNIQSDM